MFRSALWLPGLCLIGTLFLATASAMAQTRSEEQALKELNDRLPDIIMAGRDAEAVPLIERQLAWAERLHGTDSIAYAKALWNNGLLYIGRYERTLDAAQLQHAKLLLQRAYDTMERKLPPEAPDVYALQLTFAAIAKVEGREDQLTQSTCRVAASLGTALSLKTMPGVTEEDVRNIRAQCASQIDKAWFLAQQQPNLRPALAGETFVHAQWFARLGSADASLLIADRTTTNLPRLKQTKEQIAARTGDLLTAQKALARARSSGDKGEMTRALQRIRRLEEQIAALRRQLDANQPAFVASMQRPPLNEAEVRRSLRPGEAMLLIATFEQHSHVWLVDADQMIWLRLDGWGRERTGATVKALRCGLDAWAWTDNTCAGLPGTNYDGEVDYNNGIGPPFDFARASQLYEAFFRPFEATIANRSVFVVTAGPLATIPLHVMLSEPLDPSLKGLERYHRAKWIALRGPGLTLLPSVSALAVLREPNPRRPAGQRPFIGFGNPLLDGKAHLHWDSKNRQTALQLQSCAAAQTWCAAEGLRLPAVLSLSPKAVRSTSFLAEFRSQSPLPDTACELCASAAVLGMTSHSEPDIVWLGARATERNVKALSRSGALAKFAVVQFATHGLLAGDSARLGHPSGEPGLLLTTPPDGTAQSALEEDDGLLTASEIAPLDLAAEWVILSACNTAAGQIDEAEPLSGLARAFFAAGARALLVSNWAVDSFAATKLTTTAIREMKGDPAIGRARALQRAMQLVMKDTSRTSNAVPAFHPAIWAPFMIVGDGGR